jgi:hypothetical protein
MHDGLVKDRLLGNALTLFAEDGFDAVSVDKVRTAAGARTEVSFICSTPRPILPPNCLLLASKTTRNALPPACPIRETRRRVWAPSCVRICAGCTEIAPRRDSCRARSAWFAQAARRLKTHNAAFVGAIDRWRSPLLARGQLRPMPIEVFMSMHIGPANLLCRMRLTGLKPSSISPLRFEQELVEAARRALVTSRKGASQ